MTTLAIIASGLIATACAAPPRATGDLGVVVERAAGSVQIIETSERRRLARIQDLGDLSHASLVFSRDQRYAYVFGRDGGLTKIDLLADQVTARILQAGNSIGGAISQDGRLLAVANYEPGGVKLFDAGSLEEIAEIPAVYTSGGARAKVVGLEDVPGNRFVFSLFEAGEIWIADVSDPGSPAITRHRDVGDQPYDSLITPDGRHYIAGLFGEDGMVAVDLWDQNAKPQRILDGYGRGEEPLPVYKMPHLKGWAVAGDRLFLPAIGRHEVLVAARDDFREVGRVSVHGQPVFAIARPDGRQVWVNFAHPRNDVVQVIDVPSLEVVHSMELGRGVLHMEFTPRGEEVWISVRDEDRVEVFGTDRFDHRASLPADKPSGIFFTARAHRIGY